MVPFLARLSSVWQDTLFPPACLGCHRLLARPDFFCPACAGQIEGLPSSVCRICGVPLRETEQGDTCISCQKAPPAFDRARALALYRGPLAEALRRFKYRRHWATGAALAGFLARNAPLAWLAGFEVLAPVPLHPRRLISRGFNQAVVLSRALARKAPLRLAPRLLKRLRHTRPQVGLNPQARRQNVAGAFAARPAEIPRLRGASVLLVDDVFTTGATAEECARVLKRAGATRVGVLTLVRAASGDLLADRPPKSYDRTSQEGESEP